MRGRTVALVGICLLLFAGVAGAVVYFSVALTPTSVNEGANKLFRLTITNDLASTESIKKVNISFPNYVMTNVIDPMSGWSHVNGSDWIVWSGDLSAGGSQIFQFWATAPLGIGSDTNSTVTVDIFNSTGDIVNSTTDIVTTTDDTANPTAELVSPPDGNYNTNGVTFTCNATDNAELKTVSFFWNHSGTWTEDSINDVEGSGTSTQTAFVKSGLNDGDYVWGCRACDTAQNCVFSATNRTITIDTIAPMVTLYSPVGQVYTSGNVEVNYSASDVNPDSCWYEISGTNTSLPGCSNATLSLADGSYTIIVWANDTATNINGAGTGFSVDTTVPEAFLGPIPPTFSNTSATDITFSLYCTDNIAVDELHLWGDWSGWSLVSANATPHNNTDWEVSVNGIPEGTWVWGSWCNDTAGLSDRSDVNNTITVDRTLPTIAFASPTPGNDSYLPVNTFSANVTHTEAYPDTIIFYLSGNTPQTASYTNGASSSFNTPALADGIYTYYLWLNDTAGNSAQTATRTVTIDTTSPLVMFITPTPANDARVPTTSSISINVSHTELNQDSVILEVNGVNSTYSYMTENYTFMTKSWGSGTYNYTVYVNDSAGNVNSTEMRNVTFYVPPPPAPPSPGGYVPSRSGGYSAPTCIENWECTDWSTECVNFEYTRVCTDLNGCGTDEDRPAESIACAMAAPEGPSALSTICTPGSLKCSGSNLVSCNPVGTAWNLVTACEYGCRNAACNGQPPELQSDGELGLTGLLVGQGANALAIAAGILVILGGAYYYFRIRRFRVL